MMLRSQGIPARMAVGFKALEYNTLGKFYMVRQRHAHAWVEAYLEPQDIPEGALKDSEKWRGGAWLRLDPTPPEEVESTMISRTGGFILRVRQIMNYIEALWQDFVGRGATNSMNKVANNRNNRNNELTIRGTLNRFLGVFNTTLGAMIGIAGIGLIGWGSVVAWRSRRRIRALNDQARRRKSSVDFFAQLEAILAANQLERPGHLTPREHVAQIETTLQDRDPSLPQLIERIVNAYYQVRFGKGELDGEQRDKIQLALSEFESALAVES